LAPGETEGRKAGEFSASCGRSRLERRHTFLSMTSRIVTTGADRDLVIELIKSYKLPFTVQITKGKNRSIEQNKLQRLWLNEAAEQLGDDTAEGYRAYCKLHFGVPILRGENEEFREAYDKIIRPHSYEDKL